MIKNEALKSVPLLFVANKQDKSEALSLDRLKDIFRQSAQYMGKRDCHSVAASAILGEGINEGIEWLVNCMKRNSNIRPPHNEEE
ncbi:ADP-ribosylation factor-related protein 1-like protein [Dinothrombium tinctorium]|uniref:ADP-ribosylation factor-related protein 1-like protein n=1 Tax=Dinothrombium tinctorium TaxID=1965070 RepID=A0A443RAY8_9ACAR|nr:ADP-ribosylation factor-related protein 1-like protein [Dinothrombium tinctorium]RWS12419.1 ADP-ribosylation factor-related protein 1-like protein [Dinothrombium tinctorium]